MTTIENIEVLVMQQMPDAVLDRIAKVDPRVKVVDARGWFDVELRATWPQWTVDRYLGSRKYPATTLRPAQPSAGVGRDHARGLAAGQRYPRSRAPTEMGP